MSKKVLTGFATVPDTGSIKSEPGEYESLQNYRGWGKFGAKRQGVQTCFTQAFGVMGMFDLKNDGDPTSMDKILIVDANGSITLYDFTDFIIAFDYEIDTTNGGHLVLQSPDLNWWQLEPNTSGVLQITGSSAPGTTISTNLRILQNQYFGFLDNNNLWGMYVDAGGVTPLLKTKQYSKSLVPVTKYTTIQGFTTGFGPVLQDTLGQQWWRIGISNAGAITYTSI